MKENFEHSLGLVLQYEGGFANHPLDKGGPTNQGITLATLKQFNREYDYGDLDGDGDVDIDDIRVLDTPSKVAPIYRKYFWDKMRLDEFPAGVDFLLFDFAVNSGPKNAARILQRALNRMRQNLLEDGVIGNRTISAAAAANKGILISDLLAERDIFYRKIVATHPEQEVFLKGWLNRINRLWQDVKHIA